MRGGGCGHAMWRRRSRVGPTLSSCSLPVVVEGASRLRLTINRRCRIPPRPVPLGRVAVPPSAGRSGNRRSPLRATVRDNFERELASGAGADGSQHSDGESSLSPKCRAEPRPTVALQRAAGTSRNSISTHASRAPPRPEARARPSSSSSYGVNAQREVRLDVLDSGLLRVWYSVVDGIEAVLAEAAAVRGLPGCPCNHADRPRSRSKRHIEVADPRAGRSPEAPAPGRAHAERVGGGCRAEARDLGGRDGRVGEAAWARRS